MTVRDHLQEWIDEHQRLLSELQLAKRVQDTLLRSVEEHPESMSAYDRALRWTRIRQGHLILHATQGMEQAFR